MKDAHGKLRADLDKVLKKHGVAYWALTGNQAGEYLGITEEVEDAHDILEIALNVGRLWQFVREVSRKTLNKFDKEAK